MAFNAATWRPEVANKSDIFNNAQGIEVSNIPSGLTNGISPLAGSSTHRFGGSQVASRPPSRRLKRLPYRIPVEIFDLILGEVNLGRDRLVTLRSLAVVSETFLSICRRLLFRDIKIAFAPDESLVEYNSILKPFIEFTTFLISRPEILGAVRKLVLFNAWGGKKLRTPYPAYTMASANLLKVISRLKCLKSLELSSNPVVPLNWPYFDSSIKKAIADALQQTPCMHMSLANVQGICENDISFILMFCKNLELNACTLLPRSETLSHFCAPSIPTNRSLKVSDRLDINKVASFPRGLLVGLSSLILVPGTGQLESFLEISRAARHTLLDLEWRLGYCMNDFANVVDLGSFPNLRSFAIRCSKYGERFERLTDILLTAAMDNEIETITIILAPTTDCGLYYFINDFRWRILDELLRGERFKNLKTFVLRLQWIKGVAHYNLTDLECEWVLGKLKDRLPGLKGKNIAINHDEGLGTYQ